MEGGEGEMMGITNASERPPNTRLTADDEMKVITHSNPCVHKLRRVF